jgi:hypothetical protein
METAFAVWLVLTILMNLYICWRWASNTFLNVALKTGFFFVAVGGIIVGVDVFHLIRPL